MHSFQTVADIHIAPGGAAQLDKYVDGLCQNRRIAIITDQGICKLGLMESAIHALKSAGYDLFIFDEIVADPPEQAVLRGAEAVKQFDAGLVIGFGGGSPMDSAKVIAHLTGCDQPIESLYGVGCARGPKLPLLLIPTTAGTGSEVSNIAIITTGKTVKKGIVANALYADRVLLDAELTFGLSKSMTAATGIDAMVHAIEAYTSIREKNPISDTLALSALRKLRGALVTACTDGNNVQARNDMLIGAMLAGQAFSNAPCAAVHALAYPLGGFFHVSHGLSNALVLIEVMKYNQLKANEWYGEIARDLGVGQNGSDLIDEMYRLKVATDVPVTLKEVGVSANAIPMMAEDAMTKTRLLINNPREMTYAAAIKIYETISE